MCFTYLCYITAAFLVFAGVSKDIVSKNFALTENLSEPSFHTEALLSCKRAHSNLILCLVFVCIVEQCFKHYFVTFGSLNIYNLMRFEIGLTYLVMTHIIFWLALCLDIVFPSVCLQTPSAWMATVVTPSKQLTDSKVQTMVRLNVDPKEDKILSLV